MISKWLENSEGDITLRSAGIKVLIIYELYAILWFLVEISGPGSAPTVIGAVLFISGAFGVSFIILMMIAFILYIIENSEHIVLRRRKQ